MLSTLDLILRPIARLAIAKGQRFADVSEQLRRAFLMEARTAAGASATVSQLAIVTSLQRRDFKRLLDAAPITVPTSSDPLSKLVALWLADHSGDPLNQHGDAPSFDALARKVRKDVHPRTLLDRLEETGTAQITDDMVHLLKPAYVPLEGSEAQLRYLSENVGDHLATAVGNVLGDPEAFDLAVHYDGLSLTAIEELETLWRARMDAVLQEVNQMAAAHQNSQPGALRFRAGGYFRKEEKT